MLTDEQIKDIALKYTRVCGGYEAHEAFHAVKAFYMASHLRVPLADESNELFAYTMQELVKNIVRTIGKKRIIL